MAIAARVAAQLEGPETRVEMKRGGIGELSVTVDGEEVYAGSRLWYPKPAKVLAALRAHIVARRPPAGGSTS